MVPHVTKGGGSFKGAAAYYLHDKEAVAADRVAWTETVNLITSDPEKATRVMAATAMAQNDLKLDAGIKATGRSLEKPVYAYSLSWHPDERPSKADMVEAARESLKVLGVEDRQALIVCHNDEPHAHVHMIVNRVSMEDGRAANMRGDHLKLSRWAESWEKQHGKIWCEERVHSNERRTHGEFVRGNAHVPRPIFEMVRDGTKGFNDNHDAKQAAADLKADQQKKATELAGLGRAMHEHYRSELSNLAADYRRDKAMIGKEQQAEMAALKVENSAMIRGTMAAFSSQQDQTQRATAWREKSLLGRVWNAVDAGRTAESFGQQVGKTLWTTASTSTRMASLHAERIEQRQAAYLEVTGSAKQREADLCLAHQEKFDPAIKISSQREKMHFSNTGLSKRTINGNEPREMRHGGKPGSSSARLLNRLSGYDSFMSGKRNRCASSRNGRRRHHGQAGGVVAVEVTVLKGETQRRCRLMESNLGRYGSDDNSEKRPKIGPFSPARYPMSRMQEQAIISRGLSPPVQ